MSFRAIIAASVVFLIVAIRALAAPQLSQPIPFAIAPGKTTELTLQGGQLLSPLRLWTTFTAKTEFVPAADDAGKKGEKLICHITVPRGEQVGIGALRLISTEGISNPVFVVLDDLPTVAEVPDNHTVAQAQKLQPPIAVDGQCDAVQEDFYRFHANAGERLSFEVVSQRIGARLDPVVHLYKADGREIERFDDADCIGGDVRFAHTFEAVGDYILALTDVRHLGGGDYRYRLRIGSFPLVAAAYPLGGRSGEIVSFEAAGDGIESQTKLLIAMPDGHGRRQLSHVGIPSPNNRGSGWFPVEVGAKDEASEREPNNSLAEATPVAFPSVVNGNLDKQGDRDFFRFKAKKGQRIHALARTRELGSACEVFLALLKADGNKIAEARQDRQTILAADIPADGEYIIQVDDLLIAGPATHDHAYRIDLDDTYVGFRLYTDQLQYNAPQGGTFTVKVMAQRPDFSGPIELAVEGLGDGAVLAGNKLDGTECYPKITLPANLPAGEMRFAKIVGKAKVGDQVVTVPLNQRETLRTLFPNTEIVPAEFVDTIAIGVGPPFPAFYDLAIPGTEVYLPQLIGASSFDINISRINEAFKEPVSIAIEGLPKDITAKVEPVGDGLKAMRVSLTASANMSEKEFPIRITGTGVFQDQTKKVVLDQVKLRVTKPLVINVAMAGPIIVGGQQTADIHLQRFGNEPQPVRLQVSDGPAGLSAPIFLNIPANATQAKMLFTADAKAAPGKYQNLVVVATTTVKGQNISVISKPAPVEIQPAPAK
jgi:hypothetical protein